MYCVYCNIQYGQYKQYCRACAGTLYRLRFFDGYGSQYCHMAILPYIVNTEILINPSYILEYVHVPNVAVS